MFLSFDQGDRTVCREVRVPTPEDEDAKRLDTERLQLSSERTRHVNRIRTLLNLPSRYPRGQSSRKRRLAQVATGGENSR
ncbi:hypothetical protein [Agrobacterium cavarae]|uniref:hypothetical protein n=1 Tax=Agrobacterium cavarae TaxID=2528239 RepID=UPI0035E44B50